MKRTKLFIVFILLGFTILVFTSCQKEDEQPIPDVIQGFILQEGGDVYEGVTLEGEILIFEDWGSFNATYEVLDSLFENEETPEDPSDESDECIPDSPVLDAFENGIGFSSLRKMLEDQECQLLNEGIEPSELPKSFLVDDIFETLVNSKYQIGIADTLFYMKNEYVTYLVTDGDLGTLEGLMAGGNPLDYPNVLLRSGSFGNCVANFYADITPGDLCVQFNYAGIDSGNSKVVWSFDGDISFSKNPVHCFDQFNTDYDICLHLFDNDPVTGAHCEDILCYPIRIKDCVANFTYTDGNSPGEIIFTETSQVLQGSVTERSWIIEGTVFNANQSTFSYTFPCDKKFEVTLQITTSEGCTDRITRDISVTTHKCCGTSKAEGSVVYANKKQITYKQKDFGNGLFGNKDHRKIKAKMWHYKFKSGKWRKRRERLKVRIDGSVYRQDVKECICEDQLNFDFQTSTKKRKRRSIKKKFSKRFRTDRNNPWHAKYYVDGNLVKDQASEVTCK